MCKPRRAPEAVQIVPDNLCEIHPCISSLRDHAGKRMSKFAPDKFVELGVRTKSSLCAKYKKTRLMRVLLYLAEGVGFEPTLGLTLNTLSRRAP